MNSPLTRTSYGTVSAIVNTGTSANRTDVLAQAATQPIQFQIVYDGFDIRFFIDSTLMHTVNNPLLLTLATSSPLYFGANFGRLAQYAAGEFRMNVSFNPIGMGRTGPTGARAFTGATGMTGPIGTGPTGATGIPGPISTSATATFQNVQYKSTSAVETSNWEASAPIYAAPVAPATTSAHWSNLGIVKLGVGGDWVRGQRAPPNAVIWTKVSTNTTTGISSSAPASYTELGANKAIQNTLGAPAIWNVNASFVLTSTAGTIRAMIVRYDSLNNATQEYFINDEPASGPLQSASINATIRMGVPATSPSATNGDYIVVYVTGSAAGLVLAEGTRLSITVMSPTSGGGAEPLNGRIINVKPSALPRVPKNKSLTVTGMKYAKSRRRKGARKGTVKR